MNCLRDIWRRSIISAIQAINQVKIHHGLALRWKQPVTITSAETYEAELSLSNERERMSDGLKAGQTKQRGVSHNFSLAKTSLSIHLPIKFSVVDTVVSKIVKMRRENNVIFAEICIYLTTGLFLTKSADE